MNLQVADTLINFELPWNPAKKNQRIGRIDRIGQNADNLTIVNFITNDSVEVKIAQGLIVKQSLFDGVLGDNGLDEVDFTTKGRSQFIRQLEEMIDGIHNSDNEDALGEIDNELPETNPEEIPDLENDNVDYDDQYENEEDEPDIEKTTNTQVDNEPTSETEATRNIEQMEEVLNSGMQFLSGMFKMATGKDMDSDGHKIEVDKETGEVVMRFKLPK